MGERTSLLGEKHGEYVPCNYCGILLYRTQYRLKKTKHHFCDNNCQKLFQHELKFENRKCEVCGKEFHVSKKSTQRFCSNDCQHEWQKTRVGVLNPKFTSIPSKCDWCGKEIYIAPYKIGTQTNFFCSTDCRRNWYSRIWSQSEEWKNESKKRAAGILSSCKQAKNTKPQMIVNRLLDENDIKYVNEYNCLYYSIDNYLSDSGLMIEVMGDFWHCTPLKYSKDNIRDIQKKRIPKDKAKHTYIRNRYGIEILYLWENDIYNREDICMDLINKYIENNGRLENYHSFNYSKENNELIINKKIIYPFFEKDIVNA